ncbi:hypothetical protein P6P90_15235 [Ectobacillus antri]|uniref:MarR family transcriptional regulator n=1 Tax=Ectobacillus antri TaxID=2486280 RepID=A0ABT6HA82_9BACI|nr:hypothetical protein [Ectobacillus antri]MDG4658209.1 hypothetical protein [Ectobacillus antri]MDG5755271.1 hypothetical protein [Ectobacillus antri]
MNRTAEVFANRYQARQERLEQRELILHRLEKNVSYLKEVMSNVGFPVVGSNVQRENGQEIMMELVNHDRQVETFNTVLSLMGLGNYRLTPKGKLCKLVPMQRNEMISATGRRVSAINQVRRVTAEDVKLLGDMLHAKHEQISTYLQAIRNLEI